MKTLADFLTKSLLLGGVFTWLDYLFSHSLGIEEG